jgi:Kef-type K+ transport system membrane component KefB
MGMKFTLAISFGLLLAFLAAQIGLAPIVGAFAAGLVLDPVHFRFFNDSEIVNDIDGELKTAPPEWAARLRGIIERHAEHHVQELVAPIGFLLVPIFFLLTGMDVHLESLLDPTVLVIALGITLVAFIGKLVAGTVAGKANKLIVGVGMIPRGEVGLIFAATGKSLNVVNDKVFSIIVIVVILSTLVTPPLLAWLLKRANPAAP